MTPTPEQRKQKILNLIKEEIKSGWFEIRERDYIDRWFCYEYGYLTKNGNANWNKIPWNEYVSVNAMNISNKSTKFIMQKEHIVPANVIKKWLLDLGEEVTIKQIEDLLRKWLMYSTITKEEDKQLLKQEMPDEFYDPTNKLYLDPFARYKVAGVNISKHEIVNNLSKINA